MKNMEILLSAHQPDILPYSGFWYKMAVSDLFDIAIYDQFQKPNVSQNLGYQQRVLARKDGKDFWLGHKIVGSSYMKPIKDIIIDCDYAKRKLVDYLDSFGDNDEFPMNDQVYAYFVPKIIEINTDKLWEFNLELILMVRDYLGIRTPLGIATKPQGRATQGIIDLCNQYHTGVYLSGQGGKNYLDVHELEANLMMVEFSKHKVTNKYNIIDLLMREKDPMSVIMEEE